MECIRDKRLFRCACKTKMGHGMCNIGGENVQYCRLLYRKESHNGQCLEFSPHRRLVTQDVYEYVLLEYLNAPAPAPKKEIMEEYLSYISLSFLAMVFRHGGRTYSIWV